MNYYIQISIYFIYDNKFILFSVIISLYLPVAIAGYGLLGNAVKSNILLSVPQSVAVQIAIVCEIINLVGTYIISFSPVCQGMEESLKIPPSKKLFFF